MVVCAVAHFDLGPLFLFFCSFPFSLFFFCFIFPSTRQTQTHTCRQTDRQTQTQTAHPTFAHSPPLSSRLFPTPRTVCPNKKQTNYASLRTTAGHRTATTTSDSDNDNDNASTSTSLVDPIALPVTRSLILALPLAIPFPLAVAIASVCQRTAALS